MMSRCVSGCGGSGGLRIVRVFSQILLGRSWKARNWELMERGLELGSRFARTHRNVCTECGIYYDACQKTRYPSLFDERVS